MPPQKCGDAVKSFRCIEGFPAVCSAVDDVELDWPSGALIATVEFMGLVDWHLRVLIAVQQEQGRISLIEMGDRARPSRDVGPFVRLPAQQKLQRRNAHAQTMRRGLVQNRLKIGRSIEGHDRPDRGRSVVVISDRPFKDLAGDSDQCSEMSTGGSSGDGDALRVNLESLGVRPQKPDGRFDVVHLRWMRRDGTQPIVDTCDSEAALGE